MSFYKYLEKVKENYKRAVKVEWLNSDDSVNFEFTDNLYDMNVDLNVNYQNGSRRTCTLTLNNDNNKFPINFNNIWFGQKFKLWMGIYIDEKTPYYFPQGVFYVLNPNDSFTPNAKTIKINGVDKWAFLDGTLNGKLSGTYQTNVGVNLYDATKKLLKTYQTTPTKFITNSNIDEYFEVTNGDYYFEYKESSFISNNSGDKNTTASTTLKAKTNMLVSFKYSYSSRVGNNFRLTVGSSYVEYDVYGKTTVKTLPVTYIQAGQPIKFEYIKNNNYSAHGIYDECEFFDMCVSTNFDVIDSTSPFLSPHFINKTTYVLNTNPTYDSSKTYYKYKLGKYVVYQYDSTYWETDYNSLFVLDDVLKCPYTAKVERGRTLADVLLEYATILCAHIYYDVNGRLVIEPMIDTADDITDTNKEVLWDYTVEENTFLGLTQTYNFDKVYNDIIVLGNIANGYQFKARVQNRNLMSDTCVQRIGLKTKEPFEDNQYYSDEQCKELALYYAKIDTILQKSGNITSSPLYHLDVNKLITVSTPNNNMSKELFLITGFSLGSSDSMSLNVTSVNILKDFSVVEADVYER